MVLIYLVYAYIYGLAGLAVGAVLALDVTAFFIIRAIVRRRRAQRR